MHYTGTDVPLNPAVIQFRPDCPIYHLDKTGWMSAPAIAVTPKGRLWMTVNIGGADEGPSNMFTLSKSDDDGLTWDSCVFAVDHPDKVRMHEPLVWATPDGRIFTSWVQSYDWWDGRGGLWFSELSGADTEQPTLSEPRRICDGVMANDPIFLPDGDWLLPVTFWKRYQSDLHHDESREFSRIYRTADAGQTVTVLGQADVPERTFDEHSMAILSDGRWMMLVRTEYGWGVSYSSDEGKNWTAGVPFKYGPTAKSVLRNLPDGRLLLVSYDTVRDVRERITAWISEDDGKSWPYALLLDGRENVSYPNTHITPDGTIYITHDFDRYGAKEAVFHRITAADIQAGRLVSPNSFIGRSAKV